MEDVEALERLLANYSNRSALLSLLETAEAAPMSPQHTAMVAVGYGLVVILSLFGNGLVCGVVFRTRDMRRSLTHLLLANLAASDILMVFFNVPVGAVRALMDQWPFGTTGCILAPLIQTTMVYVSTITMCLIAVDRHRLTSRPLKPRRFGRLRAILAVWLLSIALAIPHATYARVRTLFIYRPILRCRIDIPVWLGAFTFVTQCCFPLIATSLAYFSVSRHVWAPLRPRPQRLRTIRMLLLVVVVFALCWIPLNLYNLAVDLGLSQPSSAFVILHCIAMSSACYNPFIYFGLNAKFRSATSRLCCCPHPKLTKHAMAQPTGIKLGSVRNNYSSSGWFDSFKK